EIDALPAHDGRVLAGFLAADTLDLDDLGAEVGQDHAAARSGLVAGQFQHADTFEAQAHVVVPPSVVGEGLALWGYVSIRQARRSGQCAGVPGAGAQSPEATR